MSSNVIHDSNTVATAIQNAPPILPETKRINVRGDTRAGEEFIAFTLISVVRTTTRFSGKFKALPDIDAKTLSRAANDLDFAFDDLGPDGLFKAYQAAIASHVATTSDTNIVRRLWLTYVGLLSLGFGLTPDLTKIPQPFARVEGFVPEVVA